MAKNSAAIEAKTYAFGNYLDPDRALADLPNMALVEVNLPEYQRNGLGRALLRVVRYHFVDTQQFGAEGMSIGASTSRGHMVYEDMAPKVIGETHSEVQSRFPKAAVAALLDRGYPMELVTLGLLRSSAYPDFEELCSFLDRYHARASWLETHATEVRFANLEAEGSDGEPFDWDRLLKA